MKHLNKFENNNFDGKIDKESDEEFDDLLNVFPGYDEMDKIKKEIIDDISDNILKKYRDKYTILKGLKTDMQILEWLVDYWR